jgi:hypothetical protein
LPKIEGDVDIILDIYSHHSLKTDYMNDEYGDTDRLVELGGKVLDMALASHLFHKRPILLAEQISVRILDLPCGAITLTMLRITLERLSRTINSGNG